MRYIIKQKLNITDLVNISNENYRILLHEPEEFLAGIYKKHLNQHNFEVLHIPVLKLVYSNIESYKPDILIFNVDELAEVETKIKWLKKIKANLPEMKIISTGFNTNSDTLRALLGLGVASHMNRRLSRPQDLVIITKTVLGN